MIERHQDYQLSLPTVPTSGLENVPLQLDSDAPFALRLVKTRNLPLHTTGFRFRTARDLYQSPNFQSAQMDDGTGSAVLGQGMLVYPQLIYPVNGTIVVDVENNTGAPLTNVRLLFRGSKLFPDGALPVKTYPPRLSTLPYVYPLVVPNVPVTGSSTVVPGLNCSATLNNVLNIQDDADFVMRYLAADPFALSVDNGPNFPPQFFNEVYVQIRDEARKSYSNEPIHIYDLFTAGTPAPFGTNPANLFFPGLLTPEIYLNKLDAFYVDIYRDDAGLENVFPVTINFRFSGAKVFLR